MKLPHLPGLVRPHWIALAVVSLALIHSSPGATIIYQQDFSGGATALAGTAPTIGGNAWQQSIGAGTTTGSLVNANGTMGALNGSLLLPFTPQSGNIYTLTASITVPANMGTNSVMLGFGQASPGNVSSSARFVDAEVSGSDFMILASGGTTAETGWGGLRAVGSIFSSDLVSTAGTYTLQITLDTTTALWTTSMAVNGVTAGTYAYTTNPTIHEVGFSLNRGGATTTSPTWNSFELTVAPEPPVAALCGIGLALLALSLRRRALSGRAA